MRVNQQSKLDALKELFERHPLEIIPLPVLVQMVDLDTRHGVYVLVHRLRVEHDMQISTVYRNGYVYHGHKQSEPAKDWENCYRKFVPYRGMT